MINKKDPQNLSVTSASLSSLPSGPVSVEDVIESFCACSPIFHALGDRFRQEIVMLLARNKQLNVNQITAHLPLSRPAVSHHLKVLLMAGILERERVSRENYYALSAHAAIVELCRFTDRAWGYVAQNAH